MFEGGWSEEKRKRKAAIQMRAANKIVMGDFLAREKTREGGRERGSRRRHGENLSRALKLRSPIPMERSAGASTANAGRFSVSISSECLPISQSRVREHACRGAGAYFHAENERARRDDIHPNTAR